jgi:hypothetical protein
MKNARLIARVAPLVVALAVACDQRQPTAVDVPEPNQIMASASVLTSTESSGYPNGMISCWKFDNNLNDELGAFNAVMGPSGSFTSGMINTGLRGARTCSNQIAARADGFPNLESFSVEAWIRPACPGWQGSLSVAKWADLYGGPGFILMAGPDPYNGPAFVFKLHIHDNSISRTPTSSTYPCGSWYHVVGIRDKGNEIMLFVNGVEVASVVDDVGSISNTQPLTFHGALPSSCHWGMSEIALDEVAVYDGVLSAAEIEQHYQDGLNGLSYCEAVIDDVGPETSTVVSSPNPVAVGGDVDLTASVDDAATGDSNILSAEYSVDGGGWAAMSASDGIFDEVLEGVEASFSAPTDAGLYDVCVRGMDVPGNLGGSECTLLVVYDPSAGFVTGGGWIDSPEGAYGPDAGMVGRATFGFVSKYKKNAETPDGNTEFQLHSAGMNFHATSFQWLVVEGPHYAYFRGEGTVNGMTCDEGAGDPYNLMLWAGDNDPDTFRIRIWCEGDGFDRYDNGFDQPLGSGSIVIHAK